MSDEDILEIITELVLEYSSSSYIKPMEKSAIIGIIFNSEQKFK
jgi:hypothetical protein